MAIFGTDGADTISGTDADDEIFVWASTGSVATDVGPNLVNAGLGDDTVTGGDASDTLFGNEGNDQLFGGGDLDRLFGGQGEDYIVGGPDSADDVIDGGAGGDTIDAGAGEDTITAGAGDDWILARTGADVVDAGAGADTVSITFDTGLDELDGGDGTDQLDIDASALAFGLFVTLGPDQTDFYKNFERLAVQGGLAADTLIGGAEDDRLSGGAGADDLRGGGDDDGLNGGAGSDTILGGGGDDNLDGGATAGELDSLDGGRGDDRWSIFWTGTGDLRLDLRGPAQSTELLADGLVLQTGVGLERLNVHGGSGDDTVTGAGGDDSLSGGVGANSLSGGAGDDTITSFQGISAGTPESVVGGSGLDTWRSDWQSSTDALTLSLVAGGSCTLFANGVVATVATGLERLSFAGGTAADSLEGARFDDALSGRAGADTLRGFDGDDTLDGGADADRLEGGKGDDVLSGRAGFDQLSGGSGDDTLTSATDASGSTVLRGGAGVDTWTVFWDGAQGVTLTLRENPSKASELLAIGLQVASGTGMEVLEAYGGDGGDRFTGAGGDDYLYGGLGADTLSGGGGDDTLESSATVGSPDIVDGGDGHDVWRFDARDMDQPLSVQLSTKPGQSTALIAGVSVVATATGVEALDAVGGRGDDLLRGGAGDDTLDGYRGADTLNGGKGVDTASYVSRTEGVVVSLADGSGTRGHAAGDVLIDIENLIGSFADDELTGDGRANSLRGDGGDDLLVGGGGDDTLEGYSGADTMVGGKGLDIVSYFNESVDGYDGGSNPFYELDVSLRTGVARGGDAEGDVFVGVEGIIGSTSNDTIEGDGGANVLQGDDGADLLKGGGGRDTADYSRSDGAVSVSLASGKGAGADAAGDRLSGFENLAGSRFADRLTGDGAANLLIGRLGDDTLRGGAGADTLTGGRGDDTFLFDVALRKGVDHVTDFETGDDLIVLKGEIFRALSGVPKSFAYDGNIGQDKAGRLIYDDRSGELRYDADGAKGSGKAVLFAVIDNDPRLTAEDFFVTPVIV